MNARTSVLILALLSLISTATGGFLYYHSAQKSAVKEAERELVGTADDLRDDIAGLISVNKNEVRVMARFEQLQKAVLNQDNESISQSDRILDHFATGLSYDVCYLMDGSGKTIASSNRNAKDSFVGHNYAFRPYFVDAIKGKPGTYLAVGVTSGMRGIYFSHPVYLPEGGLPIGVAVVKASTRDLDRVLSRKRMGVALLVHSSGIIFASSREDLTLKLLSRVSPEELSKIAETQQFGKGPWNLSGLEEKAGGQVVDSSGEVYLIEEIGIGKLPEWRIVYLYSLRGIYGKIVDPLVGKTGYVALILCFLVGGAVVVLYVMAQSDITQRKQTEEVLRESESRQRRAEVVAGFGNWRFDLGTGKVTASNGARQIYGLIDGEITVEDARRMPLPEYRPILDEAARALIEKNEPYDVEFKIGRLTDGAILDIHSIAEFNPRANVLFGVIQDITERKRTQEALAQSEKKYRDLYENMRDGFAAVSPDGEITEFNPAFREMLGYEDEEIHKLTYKDITPLKWHQMETEIIENQVLKRGYSEVYQKEYMRKDGTIFPVELRTYMIRDHSGQYDGLWAFVRDVSHEVALNQQLLQAQKMEAVGTLAGGIAHDFNNMLQVVLGYSEVMIHRKQEGEKDYADLRKINKAGKRGADLVRSLLTFSRKLESKYSAVNLNQEILQVQSLLSHTIPKTIKIDLHLSGDPESIKADSSQVAQVLMNLALNARDAMGDGGTLTFETANVDLDDEYCNAHPEVTPGRYVSLIVSDTGQGIHKEVLSRIFEPFFTTKEVGKGTGLGLATAYGIIKDHGGQIECHSQPGHGTTFKIYLPAIRSEDHLETSTSETDVQGGTETILLVDDENDIRDLGATLLNSFGYEVIAAENGKEALEKYTAAKDTISLVILDLIMPKMDGRRCLAEILRIDPDAKILIASGYSESGPAGGTVAAGAKGFVEKPYDMRKLMTTIREVLDGD